MPFDKWAAKCQVLEEMMDAIDGFEAQNLGRSQSAKNTKGLHGAMEEETHDSKCDSAEDLKNKQ